MLFALLTAPITLPIGGLRFVLEQIRQLAERELLDEERIREELLRLQVRLDEGEIAEDDYRAQEADIMARLRLARALRRGTAGGD
jgi:hypothetical protein